jgi:hypothetical protein
MKIQVSIEAEVSIRATLKGKKLEVQVIAIAPYGERTATHTLTEGFDKETTDQLKELLGKLLEEKAEQAVKTAHRMAMQAETYAVSKGEVV